MLKKRIMILSGELSGWLKLENLSDKTTCSLALTSLTQPCYMAIKGKDGKAVINYVDKLKLIFRMDNTIDIDGDMACIIMDDSGHLLASGRTHKNISYYGVERDFADFLVTLKKAENQSFAAVVHDDKIADNMPNDELLQTLISDDTSLENMEIQTMQNEQYTADESAIKDANIMREVDGIQCNHENELATTPKAVISEHTQNTSKIFANETVLQSSDNSDQPFYTKVSDRLKELFEQFPHDDALEELVHCSKWVRIEYDNCNYYVVGLIYEDNTPLFICYGVPVESRSQPNADAPNCEWLPIDRNNIEGKGYWVLYQNAITGETLT